MKNIDMALTICDELKEQSAQLKNQNSDAWKYDVIIAKLEIVQKLLQNPTAEYTNDQD